MGYFKVTNCDLKTGGGSLKIQDEEFNDKRGRHRKYLPYVFTEQGVAMLSAILRSEAAVRVSIQIMKAFVEMRKFLKENGEVFMRLDHIEGKQVKFEMETNRKFDQIFNALQAYDGEPKQGIFFNGQVFDAHRFAFDLIRKAKESIILIDNYIDDTVLSLFTKRNNNVDVIIYTKTISKQLTLDLKKYNEQYKPIKIEEFTDAHDRFMIIDHQVVYHIGASLKDLGKKWFAFSMMDISAWDMINPNFAVAKFLRSSDEKTAFLPFFVRVNPDKLCFVGLSGRFCS